MSRLPDRRAARSWTRLLACLTLCALLAACGSTRRGGYYQNDGPGEDIPADIASIPDAVPRIEPYAPANMRPYSAMGAQYVPITDGRPFSQEGVASWYGRQFHGERTANGERYDMYAMTAAHPTLPLPSYARVTNLANRRSVVVRINDRGPFLQSRIIDLSYAAAAKLGFVNQGSARVRVDAITPDDIRAMGGAAQDMASARPLGLASAGPADEAAQTLAVEPAIAVAPMAVAPAAVAPARPAAPASPSLGDAGAGAVYLQFGAFSVAPNAISLADRLNAQIGNIETRQAQVQHSGGLHRVRLGPYPNASEAASAALRIQEQTGRTGVIVR
jgi:rare lipoprotein A